MENDADNSQRLISIHALLAESDIDRGHIHSHFIVFLSTLSLRRATKAYQPDNTAVTISIHALLAESDTREDVKDALKALISIHALLAESDG